MEAKHTKGEWVYEEHTYHDDKLISIHQKGFDLNGSDGDDGLTSIAGIWSTDEVSFANAKLITAAPELLRACEDALICFQTINDEADSDIIKQLNAAIKKATE